MHSSKPFEYAVGHCVVFLGYYATQTCACDGVGLLGYCIVFWVIGQCVRGRRGRRRAAQTTKKWFISFLLWLHYSSENYPRKTYMCNLFAKIVSKYIFKSSRKHCEIFVSLSRCLFPCRHTPESVYRHTPG